MINEAAQKAFSQAASISMSHLSLSIRISLLVFFFIWASWCALALMKYHKSQNSENIAELLNQYVQIFFLLSIVVALVFVP